MMLFSLLCIVFGYYRDGQKMLALIPECIVQLESYGRENKFSLLLTSQVELLLIYHAVS